MRNSHSTYQGPTLDLNAPYFDVILIRKRSKGNDGGHNGLAHISATLATNEYPRIRIGIGSSFRKGAQIDFVLGKWEPEEKKFMEKRALIVIDMIRSFAFAGVELTMTAFNKAGKVLPAESDPTS